MRRWFRLLQLCLVLSLLFITSVARNQSDDCPVLVQSALQATAALCATTNTNEACYGNAHLQAQFFPTIDPTTITFAAPGDQIALAALQSLHLSPLDLVGGTWGMSLLEVQANLQTTVSDYTLLLFGDVQIENEGALTTTIEVTASKNLNVRLLPSTRSTIVTTLKGGELLIATGRLADTSWVRVSVTTLSGNIVGGTGWIYARLLTTEQDFTELAIVDAAARHYQPMQAFFFESGDALASDCTAAPRDGILIQTPVGSGRIRLMSNGVDLEFSASSTAYLTAERNGDLTVNLLQGSGAVTANGTTQTLFAGTAVNVPLAEDLSPVGIPSELQPYDASVINALPLTILPHPISAAEPLTTVEIVQAERAHQRAEANAWAARNPPPAIPTTHAAPPPMLASGEFILPTPTPFLAPANENTVFENPPTSSGVQESLPTVAPPTATPPPPPTATFPPITPFGM
jgi:uncharacterized protein YgiM (DUF1202 family)